MNTQTHVHRLEPGQALPHPCRRAGVAVLTEGELVLQPPARWLGETVVMPARVRMAAPAVLPAEPGCSFVATRASSVTVQVPTPSDADALRAAAAWLRQFVARRARSRGCPPLAG